MIYLLKNLAISVLVISTTLTVTAVCDACPKSPVETSQRYILAYLDPGTGAIVFQAIIAGIVSIGFSVKLFWGSIKGFLLKLIGKEVPLQDQPQETTPELPAGKENNEQ